MKNLQIFVFFILNINFVFSGVQTFYYDQYGENFNDSKGASYYSEIEDISDVRGYKYTDFYMDGTVKSTGYMLEFNDKNTINGIIIEYDMAGNIVEKSLYFSGKKDGKSIEFYPDGGVKSITKYKNNIKNGEEIKFFESGGKSYEAYYIDGLLNGKEIYYKLNGEKLSEIEYKNNKYDGKYIIYNKSRPLLEITYKEGIKDGKYKEYFETGLLKESIKYKKGKIVDTKKAYYDLGTLKYKINYTDGQANGTGRYYYQNGKLLSEGNFVEGVKKGIWKTYYENSNINFIENYTKNQSEIRRYEFSKNELLESKKEYQNGIPIGTWEFFDDEGKKVIEAEFKNSESLVFRLLDGHGNILEEAVYN